MTREIVEKRNKLSLIEHQNLAENLSQHLQIVKLEREFYKTCISNASKHVSDSENFPNLENSRDMMMHYSFDYAQQVHLPNDPQQPGPMFFLTPYKVQIFGVSNEALKKQCNYLIPESCTTGKGSNSVISFLHHYFKNNGMGEKQVILHADNCGGQNKNKYLMSYLSYRIIKKLHTNIEIVFMPVGHTKFYCDLAFGMLKKKFKNSFVSSLEQFQECVVNSTPLSKLNTCQLVGNEKGDEIKVLQYDWSTWFDEIGFKSIPGISKMHYFKFDKPYHVSFKQNSNNEYVEMKLIEHWDNSYDLPPQLDIPKISFERQKYLFEKIRQFCHDECKDILCPDPISGFFSNPNVTINTTARQTDRIRAIGKCSICRVAGHNKAKCPQLNQEGAE